jgi:hypothetical protein
MAEIGQVEMNEPRIPPELDSSLQQHMDLLKRRITARTLECAKQEAVGKDRVDTDVLHLAKAIEEIAPAQKAEERL